MCGFATMLRLPGWTALVFCLAAVPVCGMAGSEQGLRFEAERLPGLTRPVLHDAGSLRFVVLADRTGGHRPDVFEAAVRRAGLLDPELVLTVGDLIEGYTDEPRHIDAQWDELEAATGASKAPVLFTPGNHDVSNAVMQRHWRQRHGPEYFHFVYKGVLFLVLSTEDPPPAVPQAEVDAVLAERKRVAALEAVDPERALRAAAALKQRMASFGASFISDEQTDAMLAAIDRHEDVRWTFALMHKPAWSEPYTHENFDRIEAALADRPYTMIAGHRHRYQYLERNDRVYLTLATCGGALHGASGPDTFDHLLLVTLREDMAEPIYANILLGGLFDEAGPGDAAPGFRNPTPGW